MPAMKSNELISTRICRRESPAQSLTDAQIDTVAASLSNSSLMLTYTVLALSESAELFAWLDPADRAKVLRRAEALISERPVQALDGETLGPEETASLPILWAAVSALLTDPQQGSFTLHGRDLRRLALPLTADQARAEGGE